MKITIGMKFRTRAGEGTVVNQQWVMGKGSRKKQMFTVRWESGVETQVGKRRLTILMGASEQSRVESDADAGSDADTHSSDEPKQATMPKNRIPAGSLPADIADKGLAQILADVIGPYVTGKLDRDEVMSLIDERVHSFTLPRRVEVVTVEKVTKDVGVQHVHFDAVLRLVSAGLNVWLVGPAGSGKTSIAAAVADALDLPHYAQSVCKQTSKSDLLGYRAGGTGDYVRTDLREAYENGGVFLLDEVDAGNANVMVVMNALMANDRAPFPDAMVKRHPNFRMIAGANTIGMGANQQYVGREKLDEATRDRFVLLDFPYDPAIEAAMCGVSPECFSDSPRPEAFSFYKVSDENDPERDAELKAQCELRCMDVCRRIVQVRSAIEKTGVRHIISPRASKSACTMIRLGFSIEDTMRMAVWKGLDADAVNKIKSHC